MKYSIEPKDRIYVKGYIFYLLLKTHATKVAKNLSNKYSHKPLDTAKKSATDPVKTASKRAIQKAAEATGDLIGNKTADKITNISKKSSRELHSQNKVTNDEVDIPKKIYISPEK